MGESLSLLAPKRVLLPAASRMAATIIANGVKGKGASRVCKSSREPATGSHGAMAPRPVFCDGRDLRDLELLALLIRHA